MASSNPDTKEEYPLNGRALAYNGPGASRLSVSGSYEYFHAMTENGRKQPEAIQYYPAIEIRANVCEGDSSFKDIRCLNWPEGPCWNEVDTSEKWRCSPTEVSPERWDQFRESLAQNPANSRPGQRIRPDMTDNVWGQINPIFEKELAAGSLDSDQTDVADATKPAPVMCWRESEEPRLCYSVSVNLGERAAKFTDYYQKKMFNPHKEYFLWSGVSENDYDAKYANQRNVAEDIFSLNAFTIARRENGQWTMEHEDPKPRHFGGYLTPYFLHQYVNLERVNEGFAGRGLACSTFLSLLQSQTAYWENLNSADFYKWDSRFGAIKPKNYPSHLIREAAMATFDNMENVIYNTAKNSLNDLEWFFGEVLDVRVSAAARKGAHQVVNCILSGPDSRTEQCMDNTWSWNDNINSKEYLQNLNAHSISADWMVGRSSSILDENGVPVGGVNPRDSIWAYRSPANIEYSSEGRVCSCW
jgi:hypothetical protein